MRAKRPIYADTYDRRRNIMIVILVIVVLAAITGGVWWWLHKNPRPSVAKYPKLGVRMSQADGVLDASELEDGGVSFVYLKATQGASFVDDNFATNESRAGSLKVGRITTSALIPRRKPKPKTSLNMFPMPASYQSAFTSLITAIMPVTRRKRQWLPPNSPR